MNTGQLKIWYGLERLVNSASWGLAISVLLLFVFVAMKTHPWLLVGQIVVRGTPNQPKLEHILAQQISGCCMAFFTGYMWAIRLDKLQEQVLQVPWVRHASIERHLPNTLVINVEEHQANAVWQREDRLGRLNQYGEVFVATKEDLASPLLPILGGPEGSEQQVWDYYVYAREGLKRIGKTVTQVTLSASGGWQIQNADGSVIEVGRDIGNHTTHQRLDWLIANYDNTILQLPVPVKTIDLRYPNGFAVSPKRESGMDIKKSAMKGDGK